MRTLRELLTTWENWFARDTLTRALGRARTEEAGQKITHSLAAMPEVDPLDALRDSTELVALLTSWQWKAVYAARLAGASWTQIGNATGVTADQAHANYGAAIERQQRYGPGDTEQYRRAL